jgi:hypothetical protein
MTNYSPPYKAFSKSIIKANAALIHDWANGPDQELADSCKMVLEAAEGI